MTDARPTWELVLEAAKRLTADGKSTFKLAELIAALQKVDPTRQRSSIQPVVQGMTVNAGKGPESPCGKVLARVDHGYYALRADVGDVASLAPRPAPATVKASRGRRAKTLGPAEIRARLDDLIGNFDICVETYDRLVPFTRGGQYELHRETIDRRRALGSTDAAVHDDRFTELLHSVLQTWGIGRRASRLAPLDEFRLRLRERSQELGQLESLTLEGPALEVGATVKILDRLISELGVVENRARIVAGTKTLHHLLPDLVPPMDRAWTGAFFGWSVLDPQNHQTAIFTEAFATFAEVARAAHPSRLVGDGWRTSLTKVLDNALIGYCRLHEIGGTSA